MKTALKIILAILGLILAFAVCFVAWLTITEYTPEEREPVDILRTQSSETLFAGAEMRILSFNTGYCALGESEDFFMDGGKSVRPESKAVIEENLAGILSILQREEADIYLLQEVDRDSKRSYGLDQASSYARALGMEWAFALNFSCEYVPYPLPTIGRVESGVQTLSRYASVSAERVALPCPFSWPVSAANLKRCLLVSRYELENSDRQLVMINLHLEAYDDGEGKLAQTKMLMELMEDEYAKGNYVIAGGDFNQSFPGALGRYPIMDAGKWTPGLLEALPEGWSYAFDEAFPSCRLLNAPYDVGSTQHYVIDGYILSPNVELKSVSTLGESFKYSDHNPVAIDIRLK